MVFVIKATLKDETRRLTFDRTTFPLYSDIQAKLQTAFSLPSATQTFWVNVLYYPDDNQDARIMFKQHVCDATEYENAQSPFLHTGFPAPALVFTVLLSSDPRMNNIHSFHRARRLLTSSNDLAVHIDSLETELRQKQTLLDALETKFKSCEEDKDELGASFWGDRVKEKQKEVNANQGELYACQAEYESIIDQLSGETVGTPGLSLRAYTDTEEREDVVRFQQTLGELAAWKAGNDVGINDRLAFPPLDQVFQSHGMPPHGLHRRHRCGGGARFHHPRPFMPPPPPFHRPWGAPPGRGSSPPARLPPAPEGLRNLVSRVTDVVNNPTNAVVPAQEIKSMLDGFLANLSNQLANTFDGAPRVAETVSGPTAVPEPAAPLPQPQIAICPPHPTHSMPGAFEQTSAHPAADAQTQTTATPSSADERVRSSPPSSKLGKGGFRHKHISCDGCLQGIRGMRYKCEQCPDYDLCGTCVPLLCTSDLHPSHHTFQAMLHRGLEHRVKFTQEYSGSFDRHPATCDLCSQNIIGVRWKCLNCPDWDCCSSCSKSIQHTHPGHSFVKISRPSDYVDPSGQSGRYGVRHPHVICDGCDQHIRGTRYKCMHPDCPDFDLCENCEANPTTGHPVNHPMLKTKEPLKIEFESTLVDAGHRSGRPLHGHGHAHGHGHGHPKHADVPQRSTYERRHLQDPILPDNVNIKTEVKAEQEVPHIIKCYATPETLERIAVEEKHEESEIQSKVTEDVKSAIVDTPLASGARTPMKEPVTPLDIFTWVRHVTIPPGSTLPAGAEFTKTWKLKHFAHGHEYDFKEIRLVHASEGLLGPACKADVTFKTGDVVDGDEFEVSIKNLKVPNMPGEEIIEYWRFEDGSGMAYGQPLRLRFTVEEPQSMHSSLSRSSIIMPTPNRDASPAPTPAPATSPLDRSITVDTASQAGTVANTHSSVPTTPALSLRGEDDVISLHSSEDDSDFGDIDVVEVDTHTTVSTSITDADADEREREEFDFVDESDDERL